MLLPLLALLAAAPQAEVAGCPVATGARDAAWRAECDKALKSAHDPKKRSILLTRSAYAHNEAGEAEAARPQLEEAVRLDPGNATAWQELAYTANALEDYAAAEAAADAKIALGARDDDVFRERAYARFHSGNLIGAAQDSEPVFTAHPRDAGVLLAHAAAVMWIGRDDLARADIDSAGIVAAGDADRERVALLGQRRAQWNGRTPSGDAAALCLAADKMGYQGEHLIGDCTAAFLASNDAIKRAHYLTIRSIAWMTAGDIEAGRDDRIVAAALDPRNASWQSNLGFAQLATGDNAAAARAFGRALALREDSMALAGRAAARYGLGDAAGALADARRSAELDPNAFALTVLGDLARDAGDQPRARTMWLGAWHLGDHGGDLASRLATIGIADPDKEPAPDPASLR